MLVRTDGASGSNQAARMAAIVIAVVGAATILGAYFFQFVVGLAPCPLCLEQRIPYYVGIPLAALVAIAAARQAPRPWLIAGFAALALVMLIGAGLGVYHSGVEWHFWQGPQDCSGGTPDFGARGGVLDKLDNARVVRCDEAPWRLFGLSLAGYNVLIALALAAVAVWGMRAVARTRIANSE